MSPTTAQRIVWMGGITLLIAIAALAFARRSGSGGAPLPGAVGPYYTGRAAPYSPSAGHRRTACGELFTASLEGVAHPTLPCGVKIYILFRGHHVLTQVVDRGPTVPGRDFDLTKGLANRIGLHGTQTIKWRYAR
jgi:rare lipoprotein A (peptidoglycan hydrolase)